MGNSVMSTFLTFTNQTDADIAEYKIWYNLIMSRANNNEKTIGDGETHYYLSDLEEMTEMQVIALKIYGKRNGEINYLNGFTSNYSTVHIADNDSNKYLFPKPDELLMTGVVNCIEEEKEPLWWSCSMGG